MDSYDVIIVGAGVAGLKAASDLIAKGYSNLLIIEADNRIGGRIHTINLDDKLIELGAQWIHGQGENPVYKLMKSLNQVDFNVKTFPDETFYYSTPNGQRQDEKFVEKLQDQLGDAFDDLSDIIEDMDINPYYSVGTILDAEFRKIVKKLRIPADRMNLAYSIYVAKLKDENIDYATDSFYNVSALGYDSFEDFKGEEYVNLKHGYRALIDYLTSNIHDSKIRLNEMVTHIDWYNSTNLVVVNTTKGSYYAKRLLITLPLGCLKSHATSMFTPQLPNKKLTAIGRLGYGTVDKFFIEFDRNVFDNNEAGLQIFWTDDMHSLDGKYNLNGNKFYQGFNSFYVSPHHKNILYGFLVGQQANYAENLADNVFFNIVLDVLTQAFPYLKFPKVKRITRTKWNNNPFTKGSYSYFHVGSTGSDVKALAEPVSNRLFFAGEATANHYTSTVHGAFISGARAASEIRSSFYNY